jgi:dihydroneopterin aldolase
MGLTPSDKILIHRLKVNCILGVTEGERRSPQEIWIDLELLADTRNAARSDRLEDAVDYQKVCERVAEHLKDSKFHLVEALAESTARLILKEFPIEELIVRIFKPQILKNTEKVGVEIHRRKGS